MPSESHSPAWSQTEKGPVHMSYPRKWPVITLTSKGRLSDKIVHIFVMVLSNRIGSYEYLKEDALS